MNSGVVSLSISKTARVFSRRHCLSPVQAGVLNVTTVINMLEKHELNLEQTM